MAAYYKVEVSLNTNSVTVGSPSAQEVLVTLPLVGPAGATGATGATGPSGASTWNEISGKPALFPPSAHEHQPDQVYADAAFVSQTGGSILRSGIYLRNGTDNGRPVYESPTTGDYIWWDSELQQWYLTSNTDVNIYYLDENADDFPWETDVVWNAIPPQTGNIEVDQAFLSDISDYSSASVIGLKTSKSGNASSTELVLGSDTRLTNSRTPSSTLAHASSHHTGGTDAIAPNNIGAAWALVLSNQTITGNTLLSASRNRRITLFAYGVTANVDLPHENNQAGDVVTLVAAFSVASTLTIRSASVMSGGSPIAYSTLATLNVSGQSFAFVSDGSATGWTPQSVNTHTHTTADITGLGTAATANLDALPETIRIVGGTDATKKVAFEVDTLVSTATTRTLTVPNSSGTIALTAQAADMEITDNTKGVILKSPNNTRYRLTVSNSGLPIFTALLLMLLVSLAPAQNVGIATDTNGTILTDRTNAVTFTNPVAWNNSTNAATTISNLFSSNSLPSGAAPAGAVNTADGSGGSVFAGYVPGETFDFSPTSAPTGATAVTNVVSGISNVVWTWTAPTRFQRLQIIVVGGGGGGGSGRVSATNVAAFGGGGGAGGNISVNEFANFSGPITITVPFGGAGGAAQTNNDSNGNVGFGGSFASVAWTNGVILTTGMGNPGGGGTTTSGAAGTAGSRATYTQGTAGAAANNNAADLSIGSSHIGGSGGASITATNTATGNGTSARLNFTIGVAGFGIGGTAGSVGELAVPRISNSLFGNPGAGGGGSGLTNNAGAGASPTTIGSGGGGGGGARNGFSSGAGGNGGPSAVRIIGL